MNQHLLKKQFEIGQSISKCKKIYLDLNFWIKLRNQQTDSDKRLLSILEKLVDDGKCIVPISEITFLELLKQDDTTSLTKTATIINRLSNGISIISEPERRKLEFTNFVHSKTQKPTFDLNIYAWTKISINIIYNMMLKYEPHKLDNRFIDFLENFSFEKMMTLTENKSYKPFKYKDDIEFLNAAKEKYKNENNSFKQMYLSELSGYLELHENEIAEFMEDMYFLETGNKPTENEKQMVNPNHWALLIYNLVKLDKIKTELPSLIIFSKLNASIRWNKHRKYTDGNDTFDFLHATAALPYFDFFVTEKELKTIIGQLKLDKLYDCVVFSNTDEFINELESI